ncbi:sigma-70 family RNA polymerase sigma factor [Sphaerisporangium rubeum]|uniref:RNA polymerase sigma factor (Sigma-70 family) n=1 Tax=Sphaerisporangium rubeum TaxID=321317 RepID=A0A7X0M774_9ACTN|nr:sigma-70 family RNA polymerase sigma factor [Sphaerisporangium rubeum]MBB6472551.1 RNA polymerase sigma factor (sigma-70 family) [Sphaerisporangium rubeum]
MTPMSHDFLDERSWRELVDRYGHRMWAVARAFGLSAADASDAVQAAWLRLAEHHHTVRDPARVGAWLVTVTRNEACRMTRHTARHHPGLPDDLPAPRTPDPMTTVLDTDEAHRLWSAVKRLRSPCPALLRLMATAPEARYTQISHHLDMPIGSIGPTRSRCLAQLRAIWQQENP